MNEFSNEEIERIKEIAGDRLVVMNAKIISMEDEIVCISLKDAIGTMSYNIIYIDSKGEIDAGK